MRITKMRIVTAIGILPVFLLFIFLGIILVTTFIKILFTPNSEFIEMILLDLSLAPVLWLSAKLTLQYFNLLDDDPELPLFMGVRSIPIPVTGKVVLIRLILGFLVTTTIMTSLVSYFSSVGLGILIAWGIMEGETAIPEYAGIFVPWLTGLLGSVMAFWILLLMMGGLFSLILKLVPSGKSCRP